MSTYGYARVSSTGQDHETQVERLKAAGCGAVRAEKASASTRNGRRELLTLLEFIREGDTLMVTRFDRLARSLDDLKAIVRELEEKGATLRVLDQQIDTSSSHGKLFFHLLGAFAEFENDIRRERQMEGIARAKARGVYKGRRPTINVDEVRRLRKEGLGATAIANRLKIGRASVYRVLKERQTDNRT